MKIRYIQSKKFEDEEVEALLDQVPSQTQKELAELNVDRSTISRQGHWNDSKARKLSIVRVEAEGR